MHEQQEQTFSCAHCEESFKKETEIKRHIFKLHFLNSEVFEEEFILPDVVHCEESSEQTTDIVNSTDADCVQVIILTAKTEYSYAISAKYLLKRTQIFGSISTRYIENLTMNCCSFCTKGENVISFKIRNTY